MGAKNHLQIFDTSGQNNNRSGCRRQNSWKGTHILHKSRCGYMQMKIWG
jgi:hypothetical protein